MAAEPGKAQIDFTPRVLQNQGVPVELYDLDADGRVRYNAEGEETRKTVFLRFTTGTLAEVEATFSEFEIFEFENETKVRHTLREDENGKKVLVPIVEPTGKRIEVSRMARGVEAYNAAIIDQPVRTAIRLLSILTKVAEDEIETQMIPEEIALYNQGASIALSMAQGLDPTSASLQVEAARMTFSASKLAMNEMNAVQAAETMKLVTASLKEVHLSLGALGSQPGSEAAEDTTSSSA